MKPWLVPILIISVLANLFLVSDKISLPDHQPTASVTVSRIIDGDTLVADNGDTIRLAGIDAPEYPQGCLGSEAKDRLAELVLGQTLTIQPVGKDNFGRNVAFLFFDQILINQTLVAEGLATAAGSNLSYSTDITKAETEAKTLKKGIWSNLCLNPDCVIKGNVRQDNDTKIYHLPDCYNYQKIVIDQSGGDRWFCTEAEAKSAGFIKSLDCPGSK